MGKIKYLQVSVSLAWAIHIIFSLKALLAIHQPLLCKQRVYFDTWEIFTTTSWTAI